MSSTASTFRYIAIRTVAFVTLTAASTGLLALPQGMRVAGSHD